MNFLRKTHSISNKFRYMMFGILFGLFFPVLAYFFNDSQLFYIICSAPVVLGTVFFILGSKHDNSLALAKSKDLFQEFFEASPYPCMFFDEKGIVDCNLTTVKILNAKDKKDVLSRHLAEFSPELQPDGQTSSVKSREMNQLARANRIHQFEWMHRTFDGLDLPVEVSLKSLDIGNKSTLLAQWRDLTTEKKSLTNLKDANSRVEFYRSALDQAAIVVVTDNKGNITFVNDKFLEVSGYSRGELIGKNNRLMNSGQHDQNLFRELWATISAGNTWRGEICNRTKDGTLYWVDVIIVPSKSVHGKINQFVSIQYDITEKKQAESKLWVTTEMRRAILESANFSIISFDVNGLILSFNKTAEEMLGYNADEVVGKLSLEALHDVEEVEARAAILSYELGETIEPGVAVFTEKAKRLKTPDENEWTFVKKDKSRLSIRASTTCLYSETGDLIGYLEVAQDITESKKIHNQLIQANQTALNSLKARSEFLANMSHEIRTPMNGVIGMCNLLLGETQEPSQIEKLKIIQNCGNTLLDLINDILDFSKLDAGRVEFEKEPFPIHSTIGEIIELLNTKASEKGLLLAYKKSDSVPDWLLGDVTRFRQILMNLVGNAIKFTKVGSVTVSSTSELNSENQHLVKISVKDTGIGIPEKAKKKLFISFTQVDASTTRRFGGTGLGLAISKGISEKMGGTITVESQEGQGSTFTFSFMGTKAEPKVVSSTHNPFEDFNKNQDDFKSLRIMIAEDNRVNQQVVCGFLKKLGYSADVAANGNEVLENLKRKSYDLILMDCHMPEKDGFETTKQICQKYPKDKRPKIVALTASTMKEDIDRCFASGMDGFLNKPITIAALSKTLREYTVTESKIA